MAKARTDSEIIKAYSICISDDFPKCTKCPYLNEDCHSLEYDVLGLIGRLIVERDEANLKIDKLQNSLAIAQKEIKRCAMRRKESR